MPVPTASLARPVPICVPLSSSTSATRPRS
jgi:hypothetical protein